MPIPLLVPLAISAASGLAGYLTRDKTNPYDKAKYPEFDYAGRQQALQSRLGQQSVAAGQSAGRTMAAQGLQDSSREFAVGRGLASDAMEAQVQGTAELDALRQQSAMGLYQHNLQKEMYKKNMPDAWDYLGGAAKMAGTLAPAMSPEAFAADYNVPGANPSGNTTTEAPVVNQAFRQRRKAYNPNSGITGSRFLNRSNEILM